MSKIVEKIIPIVNMDCASCAKTIEKELKKIPGIREIKVNILMKKATIVYDPDLTELPKIERKIENIGYRIGYKKYRGVLDNIMEAFKATTHKEPRSISDHEFEDYVSRSRSLVVVEFASTSCPSCKALGRILTNIEDKYKDKVNFYQMDINSTSHWKEFSIMSVPTLIYFRDGIEISRYSELPSRDEIIQQIEKLID